MRYPLMATCAVLLAGCAATPEYYDTNAAVDANPLCVSRPDRPGEPVSRDCERVQGASISSERRGEPVDFRKRRDD